MHTSSLEIYVGRGQKCVRNARFDKCYRPKKRGVILAFFILSLQALQIFFDRLALCIRPLAGTMFQWTQKLRRLVPGQLSITWIRNEVLESLFCLFCRQRKRAFQVKFDPNKQLCRAICDAGMSHPADGKGPWEKVTVGFAMSVVGSSRSAFGTHVEITCYSHADVIRTHYTSSIECMSYV